MIHGFFGRVSSANHLKDALDVGSRQTRAIADRVAKASLQGQDGFALPDADGPASAVPVPGEPVDLNRAGADELTTLPGIGPALAARIIAWRDSAGPFPAVDSLVVVRGIGPATVERLRERIRVR